MMPLKLLIVLIAVASSCFLTKTPLLAALPGKPEIREENRYQKNETAYRAETTRFNVKDFGAKGDGKTNDTLSIQQTVDKAWAQGVGAIYFPPGIYLINSVQLRENMTYHGDKAILKRPEFQPKWTRTFTNEKTGRFIKDGGKYLIIRNLTFDGNSQRQGPYKKYELEHSDLLFLAGNPNAKEKLKIKIENCYFKNCVSDGIALHNNLDAEIVNCVAENCFRGGLVTGGTNLLVKVNNFVTKGDIDLTGIDIEDTFNSYIRLDNLNLDGDFDVGVSKGSTVIGNNIVSDAPFNLYAHQSTAQFNNCKFGVAYKNRIVFPHNVTFNQCEFYFSKEKSQKNKQDVNSIRNVSLAPFIAWNLSRTQEKNQLLIFNNCNFILNNNIRENNTIYYGIATGWDAIDYNNRLMVNGGNISGKVDIGIGMMSRGGNWKIKDTVIEADLPLSWTGYKDSLGNACSNIMIDGVAVKSKKYMYIGGYKTKNDNKLEQRNLTVDQAANYLSSTYGVEGNQYIGHRVIVGTVPPTSQTHGLVGDIYQVKKSSAQWLCIKAGYYDEKNKQVIGSQWRSQ